MNKKEYEKPTMEVVEYEQEQQLLAGSLTGNRDNPYGDPENPWESPSPLLNDDMMILLLID